MTKACNHFYCANADAISLKYYSGFFALLYKGIVDSWCFLFCFVFNALVRFYYHSDNFSNFVFMVIFRLKFSLPWSTLANSAFITRYPFYLFKVICTKLNNVHFYIVFLFIYGYIHLAISDFVNLSFLSFVFIKTA